MLSHDSTRDESRKFYLDNVLPAIAMSILCIVITVTIVLCASNVNAITNIDGETYSPLRVLTLFVLFLSFPLLQVFEICKEGATSHDGRQLIYELANKEVVSLRAYALTGWAFMCFFLILKDE